MSGNSNPQLEIIHVLIADDHDLVRRGLKQLLRDELGSVQFGEAADAAGLLVQASQRSWDVVLLDIEMPGLNGLEALRQLKKVAPQLPVLVLSLHSEDQYALRALKAGAAGYLPKDGASAAVVAAIQKVRAGGTYLTPTVAELLAEDFRKEKVIVQAPLSQRELEVLRQIAVGKSIKEIAFELALSTKTIGTFRSRLLKKLKLQTNADLIRYALRENLVT